MTDTFYLPALSKDYSYRVNDALSNSQRLLRQAHASHRCINPKSASVLANAKPLTGSAADQDALSLITIYPRSDELFSHNPFQNMHLTVHVTDPELSGSIFIFLHVKSYYHASLSMSTYPDNKPDNGLPVHKNANG